MFNNLNKVVIVSIVSFGFASSVFASGEIPIATPATINTNYVYVALQGGFDWQHFSESDYSNYWNSFYNTNVSNKGGFGSRASVGYGFNQIFSVEAGYTYLFNKPSFNISGNGYELGSYHTQTQIIDAFLKLKGPIAKDFDLYAKVGADYMFNNTPGGFRVSGHDWFDDDASKIGPAFGLGAAYNFTPNWSADVSWTRYINGFGDNHNNQPNIDFVALGLAYKFNL